MADATTGILTKLKAAIPQNGVTILAATVVGLFAGLATAALRFGLSWFSGFLSRELDSFSYNLRLLLLPVTGIFLATLYQYIIRENLEHGTEQLKQRLASHSYFFKKSHVLSPIIGCFLTLGFGGSAGGEGPSAFSGAAIGNRVSRFFKLTPDATRILFGCGAAAGIAGIFKSPIGGMLFAIEVLRMEMSVIGLVAVVSAALSSFAVVYILTGFTWNVSIISMQVFCPDQLGWIALLGVVGGLYSIYYSKTLDFAGRLFTRIGNRWVRCFSSGITLSLIIFLFPSMYGDGYNIVGSLINGYNDSLMLYSPLFDDSHRLVITVICGIAVLLLKGVAVGATNYGGGVAGIFAPAIFAGSLLGYLFGLGVNTWFDPSVSPESFALIGTAVILSGAVKAPMLAIFLAAEVSDRYGFILGFIAVSAVSYIVVWACRQASSSKRSQ